MPAIGLHLLEQAAVDGPHDFRRRKDPPIRARQHRSLVETERPSRLEVHQREKAFRAPARREDFLRDAKARQVFCWKIDATVIAEVLSDISEDIRQLERQPE